MAAQESCLFRNEFAAARLLTGRCKLRYAARRKDEIAGLASASGERIEAHLLYLQGRVIVSLRSFFEDGGAHRKQMLTRIRVAGIRSFRFPHVHPAEISNDSLEALGFRPSGGHLLYAAQAGST